MKKVLDEFYVYYTYFLRNNEEFAEHERDREFNTKEFNTLYPMSKTSYKDVDYDSKKFTLNKLQKTIGVGKSFELLGIQLSKGDKIESFTSSNKNVAKVDSKGRVTGVKLGHAIITAKTKKGKVATCNVKVRYDISSCKVKNLKQNSSYRTLIKLSWNKASYANGYRVYRSTKKDGTYKRIAELNGSKNTKFTDKKLSPGKIYYYKVKAYTKVGKSRDYGSHSQKLKAHTKK